MKKLLILGGTQFIGRNLMERLSKSNEYNITIFNRGKTQSHLFPNIKRITGDRNTDDIFKIGNQEWDSVIDVSCYFPHSLENMLEAIGENIKRLVFVSTCSVYEMPEQSTTLLDEKNKILNCSVEERSDTTNASYGNRKAECERILQQSKIDYIALRPALVYGTYDHTDRFYYWIYQALKHDKLLIPDNGERQLSLTYVHDLVNMIIEALTLKKHSNIYNAISYPQTSIGKILTTIETLENIKPAKVNATPTFLHENNISQWMDMPLWIDNDTMTFSNKKLLNDFKIDIQDFSQSVSSTIAYYKKLNLPTPKYGINEEKRQMLLEKLRHH